MRREPKKTDSIEVRVSTETKTAFMEACGANRTSASAVLRSFIDRYIRSNPQRRSSWKEEFKMLSKGKLTWRTALVAAVVTASGGLTMMTVAAPARAATDARLAALFQLLDADRSGRISSTEFAGPISTSPPLGAISIVVDTRSRPANESRAELFARLDADRDGEVSSPELAKQVLVRTLVSDSVAEADANRDNRFSAAELAAYVVALKSAAALADPAAGAGAFADSLVKEHDVDGDGLLTSAELRQP